MITAVCVVFAMLPNIEAHDQVPGAPQSRPIVIRNATVHVVDGADINDGDVLFEAGKITSVGIPTEGIPITGTPNIVTIPPSPPPTIITTFVPDPVNVPPDTVIQVTDLAGLKQTGYIEGRAYYGEVFFKDGTPFAGRYETAGRLIQVYATLQESIDSEVTTRPSAIQRSGTDINSNNPRLNIPGTPNNLA